MPETNEREIDRLYEEASTIRAEIEVLWNEAQVTDVFVKGAVSAAHDRPLLDNERGSAVSVGLLNAKKWRKLAELSEKLGRLIEDIEQARKKSASEESGKFK
jgi:hypothetical protein